MFGRTHHNLAPLFKKVLAVVSVARTYVYFLIRKANLYQQP